jgi:hypothetical protein
MNRDHLNMMGPIMASVASFIRNTPAVTLRRFFETTGIGLPSAVAWQAAEPELARNLLRALEEIAAADRARVVTDLERAATIADEPGQVALYSVTKHRSQLDELRNANDRALWMFLNEPDAFRHAEEVRFTDERRRGRMWDGFVCAPDLTVHRDGAALDAFKRGIRECFETENVHTDIFDRHRTAFDGANFAIVQITVYSEGPTDDFLEFDSGELIRRPRRPVFEAALTYEPGPGVIEVVAKDREKREGLVRLLARDLLDTEFREQRIPLRQYDLSVLMRPFTFPTDPADGLETVRVNLLRLMPVDSAAERVTLECTRQSSGTIWDMAHERFHTANPLSGGWDVTQAKLTIKFHPDASSRRGRTLPLTITMPHGCDLKDRTERERLVGNKYLRNWGILRDV